MTSVLTKNLKLALLQFHAGADKIANLNKAKTFITKALEENPKLDLVILPECFNSPYAVDQFKQYSEEIPNGETTTFLSNLAKTLKIIIVGGSIPEKAIDLKTGTEKIYNTSLTFNRNGEIIAKHRKVHLFDVDIPNKITFQESLTLSPGNKVTVFPVEDFGNAGLGICYDIRFPELAMVAARQNSGIQFYPGAFNTVTGPKYWTKFAIARAIDNQVYVVLCSPARNPNGGYQAYGHSLVVDPFGNVIVEGDIGEEIVHCELKPEVIEEARREIPITTQRRFDVYHNVADDATVSDL
ncbi:hypothetical protein CANARDRAFT_30154 [[Candida] arabinofermentans NRRL YB-2248]|uniref:CN hydrolase domain-containing protein n=1 Tax=[Candida] arabinofermentans NRRL YB-2248 TaxID=983967 RepID=A0A1E4SUN3_9ASCO|nr:hypothetical protein CANARDRAFT_30154 [[Candida] arabinofermentans NRRL YB-2248]